MFLTFNVLLRTDSYASMEIPAGNMTTNDETCFNSLAPGGSEYDCKNVIFNLVLLIG